jgi:hypothetical protein
MGKGFSRKSEEKRSAITDFEKNPDDWELVSRKVEPATAKKHNAGKAESKKCNERISSTSLSSLEHSILGTTLIEWEPVHVLYKDALNEFEGVTFNSVIEALVKLFSRGYVECQISDSRVHKLAVKELLEHYGGGLSKDEINLYPKVAVHEFKATARGKKEEAKDIYNTYYVSREE